MYFLWLVGEALLYRTSPLLLQTSTNLNKLKRELPEMCVAGVITKPRQKLVLSIGDCVSFNVQHTFEDIVLAAVADSEVSHVSITK